MIYALLTNPTTIPGATTWYGGGTLRATGASATEAAVQVEFPVAQTAANIRLKTKTAQPATGDLILAIRKNGADDAIVITVPAGTPADTVFQDTVNTVSYASGAVADAFSCRYTNTCPVGTVSAQIIDVFIELT